MQSNLQFIEKKIIDNNDIRLSFIENSHSYIDLANGEKFRSVTEYNSRFIPEFDPTGIITANVASKNGISVDEQKRIWRKISNEAIERGKKIHSLIESAFLQLGLFGYALSNEKYINDIIKYSETLSCAIDIIKPELRVAIKLLDNEINGIAGTIDLFLMYDNVVHLIDYKCCKEFTYENKYNKKEMLREPFDFLPNSHYGRYALQLGLYAWIISKQKDFDVSDYEIKATIIHINDNNEILTINIKDFDLWKIINCYNNIFLQ